MICKIDSTNSDNNGESRERAMKIPATGTQIMKSTRIFLQGCITQLLLLALPIGCAVPVDGSAGPDESTGRVSSASTIAGKRNNTPCVYSGLNGTGTEKCIDNIGFSPDLGFVIKSIRPGNSKVGVTDIAGTPVPELAANLVPDFGTVNITSNTGRLVRVDWQGADVQLTFGAVVLAATNWPGQTAYCLDIQGNPPANGTQVGIFPCWGGPPQNWSFIGPALGGFGSTMYANSFSGKCLDFAWPGLQGGKMQTWDCNQQLQQKWYSQPASNGSGPASLFIYSVNAQGAAFYLDVENGIIANWQPVWGWIFNGGYAQIWTFFDPSPNHPPILH